MQKAIPINRAEFNKSARIVSDYTNDMIFEQPRPGLMKQTFISYEQREDGKTKITTIHRKYSPSGDYSDHSSTEIL
jgi:hypothetical protein